MAVIFCASSDLMSAEHTSRFIGPFLRWWNPAVSAATILQVQFYVRKTAHLTEYALLAVFLLRALSAQAVQLRSAHAFTAIGVAAIWAATDEFHQSFVPTRTASPVDVLIDVCGAICGVLLYLILRRQRCKRTGERRAS